MSCALVGFTTGAPGAAGRDRRRFAADLRRRSAGAADAGRGRPPGRTRRTRWARPEPRARPAWRDRASGFQSRAQPARHGRLNRAGCRLHVLANLLQLGEYGLAFDPELLRQLVYAGLACHYTPHSRGRRGSSRATSLVHLKPGHCSGLHRVLMSVVLPCVSGWGSMRPPSAVPSHCASASASCGRCR